MCLIRKASMWRVNYINVPDTLENCFVQLHCPLMDNISFYRKSNLFRLKNDICSNVRRFIFKHFLKNISVNQRHRQRPADQYYEHRIRAVTR